MLLNLWKEYPYINLFPETIILNPFNDFPGTSSVSIVGVFPQINPLVAFKDFPSPLRDFDVKVLTFAWLEDLTPTYL